MQDWQLVRLDITETTADSKAILARYQLFGPPSLLYYVDGELVNKQVGEIGRQQFEQTLTALNN
jgi:thiol:disulfide interchange protein DsbD